MPTAEPPRRIRSPSHRRPQMRCCGVQVTTGECRSKKTQLSRLLRGPKGHLDGNAAQIARDSKVRGKFKSHPPPDIVPFRRSLPDLLHSTDGYVVPSRYRCCALAVRIPTATLSNGAPPALSTAWSLVGESPSWTLNPDAASGEH